MSHAETALAAFHAARDAGAVVDWQALAASLAAAIPTPKRRKADPNAAPAWWHAAPLPRAYETESLDVTFADGVTVRVNGTRAPGKPWAVERAMRGAVGFWHARTGCDGAVPAVAAIVLANGSESWDAALVSSLSLAMREPLPPVRPDRAPVTMATVEFLTGEVARRRAGLVSAIAAERTFPRATYGSRIYPHGFIGCGAWLRSLRGARRELALARAALGLAAPVATVRPVVAAPLLSLPLLTCLPLDCDAVALAMGDAYAMPVEWEIGGTVDAPEPGGAARTGPAPSIPAPPVDAMPVCPAVGEPCEAGCVHRSGCGSPVVANAAPTPREAIGKPAPVEGIASDAPSATGSETLADLTTETRNPVGQVYIGTIDGGTPAAMHYTAPATHPVIAYCLSERARAVLFERIQDGTFPAVGRSAKAGAWCVSLADARDLQDLQSVRWARMPRKPYVRIRLPVEAITTMPAPVSPLAGIQIRPPFLTGGALRGVTLHSPSTL